MIEVAVQCIQFNLGKNIKPKNKLKAGHLAYSIKNMFLFFKKKKIRMIFDGVFAHSNFSPSFIVKKWNLLILEFDAKDFSLQGKWTLRTDQFYRRGFFDAQVSVHNKEEKKV